MVGAGPVPIPETAARANSQVINHLGVTMSTISEHAWRAICFAPCTPSAALWGICRWGGSAQRHVGVGKLPDNPTTIGHVIEPLAAPTTVQEEGMQDAANTAGRMAGNSIVQAPLLKLRLRQ